jgi:hypothetical protein
MSDAAIAAGSDPLAELSADQIARWEDLLAYVTDPDCPRPSARTDTPRLLSHLLGRAGVDETEFWTFARNRRSRVLRAGYARQCRDVPGLELSAFDLDKLLKERFRREPLTIGAAWHHGYFRSYFSHAAITHPANDGLREEFSTAWDIVRKRPAVVLRGGVGARRRESLADLAAVRLDLPMIVGPLPYAAGVDLEIAYLQAIAAADAAADLRTRSLVVIPADRALRHAAELQPYAQALLVRLAPRHARLLGGVAREGGRRDGDGDGVGRDGGLAEDCDALAALLRGARIVELDPWSDGEGGGGGGGARPPPPPPRPPPPPCASTRTCSSQSTCATPSRRPTAMPPPPPPPPPSAPQPTGMPPPTGRRSGSVSSRPPARPVSPCCTTTPARSSRIGSRRASMPSSRSAGCALGYRSSRPAATATRRPRRPRSTRASCSAPTAAP